MTRDASNFRERVGSAVWLLLLLANFTAQEWGGDAPPGAAGGNVVTDAELAMHLGVSEGTISKWRSKLRAAGVIGWLVAPRQGRAYWVKGVNSALGSGVAEREAPEEKPAKDPARPSLRAAIWRAIEERSVALCGKAIQDLTVEEEAQLVNLLAPGGSEI